MTRADIEKALRTVLDPEMPVNIVDLGLVQAIELAPAPPENQADASTGPTALRRTSVRIDLVPTFVGCPALDLIRDEVQRRVGALPGVASVHVRYLNAPAWTAERIAPAGRAALAEHGVVVPSAGGACGEHAPAAAQRLVPLTRPALAAADAATDALATACPFCGATRTTLESRFGPTRCRMIYYCSSCRNTFERLKTPS